MRRGREDEPVGAARVVGAAVALIVIGLFLVLLFLAAQSLGRSLFGGDAAQPPDTVPPTTELIVPPAPATSDPDPEPFPSGETTGVPAGYRLREVPADGEWIVTSDIDGIDYAGMIVIGAPNVTISNSRIWATTEQFGIWNRDGFPAAAVENVDIICVDQPVPAAAGIAGVQSVSGSDISGCADGIKIGGSTRIVGNFIHDLAQKPGLHNDGIQMQGGSNVVIARNTIVTIDNGGSTANAAVFIQSESAPIDNVSIIGNYVDGFGFSLRLNGDRVTRSKIVDNVIGTGHLFGPTLIGAGAEATILNNREGGNVRPDGRPIE